MINLLKRSSIRGGPGVFIDIFVFKTHALDDKIFAGGKVNFTPLSLLSS